MKTKEKRHMSVEASAIGRSGISTKLKLGDIFIVECYDKHGNLKWVDTIKNLVVNEGLDDALDKYFRGSNYTAAHYIGLTSGSPSFAATDTMSSHSGWTEVTAYSETTRPQFNPGTVSGQSLDNSANRAQFSINADGTTIGGAFLCTDSTKGGTTGILYGGGAFTAGDKTLDNGDTLLVTVTCSASSS